MYDMVPHTRPLLVSGSGSNLKLQNEMETANVQPSDYVGPTSIAHLITQNASEMGIETATLIVHLPQYLTLENDYRGQVQAHGGAGFNVRVPGGAGRPGEGQGAGRSPSPG